MIFFPFLTYIVISQVVSGSAGFNALMFVNDYTDRL